MERRERKRRVREVRGRRREKRRRGREGRRPLGREGVHFTKAVFGVLSATVP